MKELLLEQGFTPYETDIYLCLLQNGSLSAYEVAEKTGLYRQACYDALNRLSEKGHVTHLKKGRTQHFKAADPKLILAQIRQNVSDFEAKLPAMLAMKKEGEDSVQVEVFTGSKVIFLALQDSIETLKKTGGDICCTSVDEGHPELQHSGAYERYEREMLQYGFRERVIIQEGATPKLKSGTTTYRSIPQKYFNPNPLQVYGNKVQILVGGTPNALILITSQTVADSFRKQFELMWSVAKPIGKKAKRAKKVTPDRRK